MDWLINAIVKVIDFVIGGAIETARKEEELYVQAQEESYAMEEQITEAQKEADALKTTLGDENTEGTLLYTEAQHKKQMAELEAQKTRENVLEVSANKYNTYFSGLRIKEGTTSALALEKLRFDLEKEKSDILSSYKMEYLDPLMFDIDETKKQYADYTKEGGYIDRMRAEQERVKTMYTGETWLDFKFGLPGNQEGGFDWLNPYSRYTSPWSKKK